MLFFITGCERDKTLHAPSNLEITEIGNSGLTLSWKDNSNNEEGFKVQIIPEGKDPYFSSTILENSTSTLIGNPDECTPTTFKVYAFNKNGDSEASNPVSITIPPSNPETLEIFWIGGKEIGITWQNKSKNKDGFTVKRKNQADENFEFLTSLPPNSNSFFDNNLELDSDYQYQISTFCSGVTSQTPSEISAKTSSIVDSLELLSHFGGETSAIDVDGKYIYSNIGSSFIVYDRNTEPNLQEIGKVDLPDLIRKIEAEGDYAYVIAGMDNLFIINLVNPSQPQIIGKFRNRFPISEESKTLISQNIDFQNQYNHPEFGTITDIIVKGNLVYLTLSWEGLAIVDISRPANPVLIKHVDLGNAALTIKFKGDFAFIGSSGGLFIADVSNPPLSLITKWEPPDFPIAIDFDNFVIQENTLYALDSLILHCMIEPWWCPSKQQYNSDIIIIDITDPLNPQYINRNTLFTNHFVNADYPLIINGTFGYIGYDYNEIAIIDFSNPITPTVIGEYTNQYLSGSRMIKPYEERAYVSNIFGLTALDISNPSFPEIIGSTETFSNILSFSLKNNIAYFYGFFTDHNQDNNFVNMNISNPSSIRILSKAYFPLSEYPSNISKDISIIRNPVENNYNYLLFNYCLIEDNKLTTYCHSDLKIIDVSDPNNPQMIKYFEPITMPLHLYDFSVKNGFAYFSFEDELSVFDLNNINNPHLISDYPYKKMPSYISRLQTTGKIIIQGTDLYFYKGMGYPCPIPNYHKLYNDILEKIDTSNPTNLSLVGSYPICIQDFFITDGKMYILNGLLSNHNSVISIIDISSEYFPGKVTEVRIEEISQGRISVEGNLLYILDTPSDGNMPGFLEIIDISNPDNPITLVKYRMPNDLLNNFVIQDGLIYMNTYSNGFQIMRIDQNS